jgi:RNA polymerase sigma-70 factor, ECF subfamily
MSPLGSFRPPGSGGAPTRSFEEFFEAEKSGLYGALCLVTHDRHEAEELTQEAFVRLFERWDRVRAMDDPTGYLYRTAMNLFRKRYRRGLLAARRTIGLAHPDEGIDEVDARDATVRALAELTPQQRASIVLTDLLGYRSEEAARMLGVRASTVRMHASPLHGLAVRRGHP